MAEKSVKLRINYGIVLFLIFLVLKLTGYIDWSWWWVTAPLWIPFIFVLILFMIFGIGVYLSEKGE